jgi:hypothetical protein
MTGTDEPIIHTSHTGNPYNTSLQGGPVVSDGGPFIFFISLEISGATKEVRDEQKKGYYCGVAAEKGARK